MIYCIRNSSDHLGQTALRPGHTEHRWPVFLAPTGAQGVTISVRPSVCLSVTKCSLFIFLAQIFKQSVSSQSAVSQQSVSSQLEVTKQSLSNQRAIREQIESTQSIEIRVIQSEPKILRLVLLGVKDSI